MRELRSTNATVSARAYSWQCFAFDEIYCISTYIAHLSRVVAIDCSAS